MNCWNSPSNMSFFHHIFALNGAETKSLKLPTALARLLWVESFILWSIWQCHCSYFVRNLVKKWMEVKDKNIKNLKFKILQITMEKWQYSKVFNSSNQSLQNTGSWFLEQGTFGSSNDTTFQPMNAYNASLNVLVDKSIIETMIGRLLIDPDSDGDALNNAVNALSIFQLQENTDEGENVNCKQYLILVGNFLQVYIIIKYIRAALSFWQCCNRPVFKSSSYLRFF